jgi:glycosyltransferase involved in cell wall biosynthesis
MDQPRVTVGLPVYNDSAGLRRTVPTVVGQTWQGPLRLLIIDDGSTDDTPQVLADLAVRHPQIEVVRHPVNQGRPYARNTILELAGDDYLAWIDAGDLWHPRKLELQLATLLAEQRRDPDTPLLCTGPLRWVFTDNGNNTIKVPEVAGDQLYSAITGRLYPYLQGIVGRAAHFRNAGGFDERLLRRQDYDFLVRFIGEGGRMVSSPAHIPVFTYVKSDVGTSPDTIRAVNRIIRAKHRPYYRRYGARLTRLVRSRQYRLVARFHRHNGRWLRSLPYKALEILWHPDYVGNVRRGVRYALSTLSRRSRQLVRGVVVAAVRPFLPVLRHPRVIDVAGRVGLRRLLTTTRAGRVLQAKLQAQVRTSRSPGPESSGPGARPPATIADLETRVNVAGSTPAVHVWLTLEQAYRSHGLLHSAESALRRGLDVHPDHPALRVRLVELLPLRREWAECIDLWTGLKDIDDGFMSRLTYERVARSLLELKRPADALAVADEGHRRWPHDRRGNEEIYLSRAALVDWKHALAVRDMPEAADVSDPIGVVTDLGFLSGAAGPVEGWLECPEDQAPVVSLVVNRQPVAWTSGAKSPSGDRFRFSLSCHELLAYLGDGDIISIECAGRALAIDGRPGPITVTTGYESRFSKLSEKIRSGFTFTKFGGLRRGNTRLRKEQTLALYREVSAVVAGSYGYTVFPFYGNLLGAVREHDFIGHDVGGFDVGYLSRHRRPDDVRAEFIDICRLLRQRGYRLKVEPWSVYVKPRHDSPVFVDLNYAWFNEAGELNLSYGWRYPPVTDEAAVRAPRESLLGNHLVPVPGNAEQVLEQIYGPSWAIPDQGFVLDVGLKRDLAYLLTVDEMTSLEYEDPDRVEAILDHHPTHGEEPAPQ